MAIYSLLTKSAYRGYIFQRNARNIHIWTVNTAIAFYREQIWILYHLLLLRSLYLTWNLEEGGWRVAKILVAGVCWGGRRVRACVRSWGDDLWEVRIVWFHCDAGRAVSWMMGSVGMQGRARGFLVRVRLNVPTPTIE